MSALEGVRLKLERAERVIEQLNQPVIDYLEENPHEVIGEFERERSEYVLRGRVTKSSAPLGVVAGDVVHNLRSALDHLAWQLALLTTPTPSGVTQFPIARTKGEFRSKRGQNMIRDLAPNHRTLIETFQPYNGTDTSWAPQALNDLRVLSNTDKHRVLNTTVARHSAGELVLVKDNVGFVMNGATVSISTATTYHIVWTKATATKVVDLGTVCSVEMDRRMRDLPCQRLQVDEMWAFVYSKQKNVPESKRGEAGDVWTWVALDADTKLVPSYRIGARDLQEAVLFMEDLSRRLANRVQLTTDGFTPYLTAVKRAFGNDIDYAQLVKVYGREDSRHPSRRYSPAVCLHAIPEPINGDPDPEKISTSYVERLNLTTRMSVRRYTRLTNAFSKKVQNLAAAVGLHFMHYNYCRPHKTLNGQTPAMAAGLEDHVWTLDELIALLAEAESVPVKRGSYRKTRERRAVSK